jgi:hypothetical protein
MVQISRGILVFTPHLVSLQIPDFQIPDSMSFSKEIFLQVTIRGRVTQFNPFRVGNALFVYPGLHPGLWILKPFRLRH